MLADLIKCVCRRVASGFPPRRRREEQCHQRHSPTEEPEKDSGETFSQGEDNTVKQMRCLSKDKTNKVVKNPDEKLSPEVCFQPVERHQEDGRRDSKKKFHANTRCLVKFHLDKQSV